MECRFRSVAAITMRMTTAMGLTTAMGDHSHAQDHSHGHYPYPHAEHPLGPTTLRAASHKTTHLRLKPEAIG